MPKRQNPKNPSRARPQPAKVGEVKTRRLWLSHWTGEYWVEFEPLVAFPEASRPGSERTLDLMLADLRRGEPDLQSVFAQVYKALYPEKTPHLPWSASFDRNHGTEELVRGLRRALFTRQLRITKRGLRSNKAKKMDEPVLGASLQARVADAASTSEQDGPNPGSSAVVITVSPRIIVRSDRVPLRSQTKWEPDPNNKDAQQQAPAPDSVKISFELHQDTTFPVYQGGAEISVTGKDGASLKLYTDPGCTTPAQLSEVVSGRYLDMYRPVTLYAVGTSVGNVLVDFRAPGSMGAPFVAGPVAYTWLEVEDTEFIDTEIYSVDFVEGNEHKPYSGKQLVNLPRDAKWTDPKEIPTLDRLSRSVKVKIAFSKPGSFPFELKLERSPKSFSYSKEELGRNPNYQYSDKVLQLTTQADGTLVVDNLQLSSAGAVDYRAVATDSKGRAAISGHLDAWRRFYYAKFPMKGMSTHAKSLTFVESEFARLGVEILEVPGAEIERVKNIDLDVDSEWEHFLQSVEEERLNSELRTKQPYGVAVVFADHLALLDDDAIRVVKKNVKVGPGAADIVITIKDKNGTERYLWNELADDNVGWFVSCKLDNGGIPFLGNQDIAEQYCSLIPEFSALPDRSKQVRIKVSHLKADEGDIILKVRCVNSMVAGVAFHTSPVICISTRCYWTAVDPKQQNQVIIHELGHKCGMAPRGTGTDRVPSHYTARGHRGNHCHDGIALEKEFKSSKGTNCVMFGAANGRLSFCPHCSIALQKEDISTGW